MFGSRALDTLRAPSLMAMPRIQLVSNCPHDCPCQLTKPPQEPTGAKSPDRRSERNGRICERNRRCPRGGFPFSKPPYAALWKSSIWRIQLVSGFHLRQIWAPTSAVSPRCIPIAECAHELSLLLNKSSDQSSLGDSLPIHGAACHQPLAGAPSGTLLQSAS
jgi:hypothetical protein